MICYNGIEFLWHFFGSGLAHPEPMDPAQAGISKGWDLTQEALGCLQEVLSIKECYTGCMPVTIDDIWGLMLDALNKTVYYLGI